MSEGLDLVEEEDQITHLLSLADESYDTEDILSKWGEGVYSSCSYLPILAQMCFGQTLTTWRMKKSTSK